MTYQIKERFSFVELKEKGLERIEAKTKQCLPFASSGLGHLQNVNSRLKI